MQRQFASGSRQAPDPFDQFLEEHNIYRKYTARDASCLFRVISEQMYDTQQHHLSIRKKCVRYMRKHRDYFQPLVARDLDEYLDDLSKPKTYGTLIELQAVGFMFEHNVMLFEPFNLGNFYVNNPFFTGTFRVFYTAERHFDSIFPSDYIKDVAVCQSICYEILYKDVFKLPDVAFAVEQMLHSSTLEETTDYRTEYNAEGYCTRIHLTDGRAFDFDLPHNTNCILENYKFCHFHYNNFMNDWHHEFKVFSNSLQPVMNRSGISSDRAPDLSWAVESVLPHKHLSCVRQLLKEGITPFPYKVAKALDPNMYRNIEFDAWNEMRKENFHSWYNGDNNFKVGAKCHVKLRTSENDVYTCHIQEIAVDKGYCLVFIEQLGEKHLVPYDSLTPLPQDQFQPWALPYHFQRHMQKYSALRLTRHYNYRLKLNGQLPAHRYFDATNEAYLPIKTKQCVETEVAINNCKQHNNCYYKLKQYTHLENFRTDMFEYCTMPLTVQHASRELEPKTDHESATGENISRAPSRSSTTGTVVACAGELASSQSKPESQSRSDCTTVEALEHFDSESEALEDIRGMYVPEFHCFYPIHPYGGGPEDYCGYVYDSSVHPAPGALMPATAVNGGTLYYMCNPGFAGYSPTGNNIYMSSSTLQPSHTLLATVPPLGSSQNCTSYYSNPCSNGTALGVLPNPNSSQSAVPAYNNTPQISASAVRNRNRNHTPNNNVAEASSSSLNVRVNFEAKKSMKQNGVDLPTDVATLRYFYNLGWEYHHMKPQNQEGGHTGSKEDVSKLPVEMQKFKLNENLNKEDQSKSDSNNNTISNLNLNPNSNNQNGKAVSPLAFSQNQGQPQLNSTHKPANYNHSHHSQRRFSARYFNSKERQTYQRTLVTAGNGTVSALQSNRYQKDYSGKCSKNANSIAAPHSSRNQISISNDTSNGIGDQQHHQTAHLAPYDVRSTGNQISQMPPNTYNGPLNSMSPYGPYEYGAEAGHMSGPAAPAAGGMFIQMPLTSAPQYGIYAAGGAPIPPPTLGMIPAVGGIYPPYTCAPPPTTANIGNSYGPPPPLLPPSNGFYVAPSNTGEITVDNGGDIMHLPCIGYPPMQFPCAPPHTPSGVTSSNVNCGNQTMNTVGVNGPQTQSHTSLGGPQGYWCLPTNTMQSPPTLLHISRCASSRGGAASAATGGTASIVKQN